MTTQTALLRDVVEFLDHRRKPVKESDRTEGPYPYYGANGQQGWIDSYLFDEPLVLLAEDGGHFENPSRGIAYAIDGKSWVNNHAHVLRPSKRIDFRYLLHSLRNFDVRPYITGSTRSKLTKDGASRIEIPLPSLDEQQRIAAVLDKAEELRAKRRAAIALLDQLPQAIFEDMFGDPESNPKGLPTRVLGDLCTRITDGTHQPPAFANSGHPFLFVRNIVSGVIDFETEKFISDETHQDLTRRCPIEVGDVIYSTVGTYGIPVVVRTTRKFAFQRHIAHIKPDRGKLLPDFLCGMLASAPLKRQADAAARGVAQKTINLADIRRYRVFAPRLELQIQYTSKIEAIHRAKAAHQTALSNLEDLLASLQDQSFISTRRARS